MTLNYFDTLLRARKGYARGLEPICKKWQITRNEMDVLLFLANNPGMDRAVDIVNGRGLSKSHVSFSVNALQSRGFLTRLENRSDRRTVHLVLTQSARPIVEAGQTAQRQFFCGIFAGVSREELAIWRQITEKVSANIQALEPRQNQPESMRP